MQGNLGICSSGLAFGELAWVDHHHAIDNLKDWVSFVEMQIWGCEHTFTEGVNILGKMSTSGLTCIHSPSFEYPISRHAPVAFTTPLLDNLSLDMGG